MSVTAELINVSEDSLHSDTMIMELSTKSEVITNWNLKMEQVYGFALDIEWFDSNNSLDQLSGAIFTVQP
jgi:hypothetical protein